MKEQEWVNPFAMVVIMLGTICFIYAILSGQIFASETPLEHNLKWAEQNGIHLEKEGDCYMNWEAICETKLASCIGSISYTYLEYENITIDDYLKNYKGGFGCTFTGPSNWTAIDNKEVGYDICFKRCFK